MGNNKISPIIIFVIVLVIVAMAILVISLMGNNNNGDSDNDGGSEETLIKPMLDLSLDTSEENQEKVTITATASMEDGSAITKIVLPDNTEILAAEANYEVTENGEYSFKAIAENEQETTVSINVSNIRTVSAQNPYIPDGFTQVEGTEVDTGFVIEDEYGNQFVWVPVASGQLTRDTMLDSQFEESASTASALVNSVAQNYGFYIGRYEASLAEINGEQVATSMAGKIPVTNITYLEAADYANTASVKYGYEGVNTAMLNSYAWDTVLKWFDSEIQNYSSNTNYGNYSGAIYPTGATQTDIVFNICDIAGNVCEWTTEIYKDDITTSSNNEEKIIERVIRGGSANISRTPKRHTGYPENTAEAYWGFRLIMYK